MSAETEPSSPQVDELRRLFDEANHKARTRQKTQTVLTVALLGVILGFLGAIYARGESMYTQEAFAEALEPQLEELKPDLEATVQDVVSQVGPHYATLGRERLERALPEVQRRLENELVTLTDTLARSSVEHISEGFERVHDRQVALIRERFPEVNDAEFAALRKQWAVEIQADTEAVLGSFRERVLTDLATLNTTIEGFRPNKYDDFQRDELVRYYAHLWLTLLDEEVLGGAPLGGSDG